MADKRNGRDTVSGAAKPAARNYASFFARLPSWRPPSFAWGARVGRPEEPQVRAVARKSGVNPMCSDFLKKSPQLGTARAEETVQAAQRLLCRQIRWRPREVGFYTKGEIMLFPKSWFSTYRTRCRIQ